MSERLEATYYTERMQRYAREGMVRAARVGNRGPVRFDEQGKIHPEIVQAYWQHGFYVFTNVLRLPEVEELRRDVNDLLAHAPAGPGRPSIPRADPLSAST